MLRVISLRAFIESSVVIAVFALAPRVASAHFTLQEPACYSEQDALGTPLKSAPCGQADPGNPVVPTGAVTTLVQGGTLTVTINETIHHPGHYRIAVAPDTASLPDDPPVTAGATPCGSTTIDPAPTLPVLADGVFVHTAAFSGPQTIEIPLPADFTCDHCVVQVMEFMSNHGVNPTGGCFYHHCADVVVGPPTDAGVVTDAGADSGAADAGMDASAADSSVTDASIDSGTPSTGSSGCGCRVSPTRNAPGLALVAFFGLLLLARRTRHDNG